MPEGLFKNFLYGEASNPYPFILILFLTEKVPFSCTFDRKLYHFQIKYLHKAGNNMPFLNFPFINPSKDLNESNVLLALFLKEPLKYLNDSLPFYIIQIEKSKNVPLLGVAL